MTGAEFKDKLNIKLDEVGSGFFDDTRLNELINSARIKIIDKKIEQYGTTKKITREMQSIILTETGITPTNATIDISATSAVVPTFFSEIAVIVTSPFGEGTVTKEATILNPNEGTSPYNEGVARYPKYQIANDLMAIQPSNATSVDIQYFIAPFTIDVTDNSTEIPYNEKLLNLIIDAAIHEATAPNRDYPMRQMSAEDVAQNP